MANILGGNDTHVKCVNTVCRNETIVKRQVTDNVAGPHHDSPEHNVIVLVTLLVRHVKMPSASILSSFQVYNHTKYHCIPATDILCPVAVFFGGGWWMDYDEDAVAEIVVVKPQPIGKTRSIVLEMTEHNHKSHPMESCCCCHIDGHS